MFTNPNSLGSKVLVGWYGLFRALHLAFNVRYLLRPGMPPFPPPAEGWSPQTVHLLNGMAVTDAVNALLALAFVYGYFMRARWHIWLGILTLTISMYAAIVFSYGTIAMGAWAGHAFGYLWFYLPFIPVIVLFIAVSMWAARG
jgi:hypothetical protein